VGSVVNAQIGDGICLSKTVVLENYRWTWLSGVILTTRNRPNFATASSRRIRRGAPIRDRIDEMLIVPRVGAIGHGEGLPLRLFCESGERMSGTQIWIGRRPCWRSRLRCARTFSRDGLE